MRSTFAAVVPLLLIVVARAEHMQPKNAEDCKTTCQRFGMKSLGDDFKQITDPTDCVKQCDKEVYPAPSALTQLKNRAAAAATTITGSAKLQVVKPASPCRSGAS